METFETMSDNEIELKISLVKNVVVEKSNYVIKNFVLFIKVSGLYLQVLQTFIYWRSPTEISQLKGVLSINVLKSF